jgi:hypothetical protein
MPSTPTTTTVPKNKEDLPPHVITPEAAAYLATLSPDALTLHELAVKMLGSSYFVDRTHGFQKWMSAAAAKATTK